jgi:hypothetical protein
LRHDFSRDFSPAHNAQEIEPGQSAGFAMPDQSRRENDGSIRGENQQPGRGQEALAAHQAKGEIQRISDHLSGIEDAVRVERALQGLHQRNLGPIA